MDNAAKSITYISWVGRSAAELLVESHETQWMLGSGRKLQAGLRVQQQEVQQ